MQRLRLTLLLMTIFALFFCSSCIKIYQSEQHTLRRTENFSQSNLVTIKLCIQNIGETNRTGKADIVVIDPEENVFTTGITMSDSGGYAYFPDNFQDASWKPGIYSWQGQIAGTKVTFGEFLYSNNGIIFLKPGTDMTTDTEILLQGIASNSKLGNELALMQVCVNLIMTFQAWARTPYVLGGPRVQNDFSNIDFSLAGKPVSQGTLVWTDALGDCYAISARGVNTFTLTALGRYGSCIVYSGFIPE